MECEVVAGPEALEADWETEDAGGKFQILLFDDDLLLEAQELARQRLTAEERAALAATVPESAQRQMLDDTAYALQMAAYAVGKPPPPPLYWQHRRGESAKLVALLAAVLLVGGLVVASAAVFGVITAPLWLTALALGRAWMHLRSRWRQQSADDLTNGRVVEPVLNSNGSPPPETNGDTAAASQRSSHEKAA